MPKNIPDTTNSGDALDALHACRESLWAARLGATLAAKGLEGARLARARELSEMVSDCIAFSERLSFVCVADQRYDELTGGIYSEAQQ